MELFHFVTKYTQERLFNFMGNEVNIPYKELLTNGPRMTQLKSRCSTTLINKKYFCTHVMSSDKKCAVLLYDVLDATNLCISELFISPYNFSMILNKS